MSEPTYKNPAFKANSPTQFFEDPENLRGNSCLSPPEFSLEASSPEMSGENGFHQNAAVCDEGGTPDPIQEALNLAYASTSSKWAKGALNKIEPILIATGNMLNQSALSTPVEGNLNHPGTYADWDMSSSQRKGLWELYKALYESDTMSEKAKHLGKAKTALKEPLEQVRRFAGDKTFNTTPGFKELAQAVDVGIKQKISAIEALIDASKPKKTKSSSKSGGGGGGGGGSTKGFNRQAITDFENLPGLDVDETAAAPAADSMAAIVEANMQRDLVINSGSVEDFLYVNIPDIVSGTGKSKTAISMWNKIKSYRDKNLTAVYGAYITHPEDEAAKLAYNNALAKMETDLGPEIRTMAQSLWKTDVTEMKTFDEGGKSIHTDIKAQREAYEASTKVAGFDPTTLDKAALATAAKGLKARALKYFSEGDEFDLSDTQKKSFRSPAYSAMQELGKAATAFGKKKMTEKLATEALQALTKAEEKMLAANTAMENLVKAIEARNESYKAITDHLSDPTKVPLVKEVKRHVVSVTFKGDGDEEAVTASYNTKPESTIGIYENVWSPRSISDKAGTFDRPGGAKRGAKVYQELKEKHGFTESEAKIMGSVSTGEGDFHSINTVDIMRISLGFIQFAGASFTGLLADLKSQNPTYFADHFEQYGIIINDGRSPLPPLTDRDTRFVPGSEHGQPAEESNRTNDKLIVYDHSARVWVSGAEAFAVLQSDPRYLTLIQSSVKDPSMQLAQIKRAKDKYHNATRLGNIDMADVGLEVADGGKDSFEVRDVFKNEMCAYGTTAWGIAAGPGKGIGLAKKVIKDIVKTKGLKTLAELQAVSQSEMTTFFKKHYEKWSRPTAFGEETGKPLSDTTYDGVY